MCEFTTVFYVYLIN